MCIGVGWRSGTRLRRNVSQIISNSNGQVGGPGPGPVVLSARCRACRGMKSIKAPVFEGRNRSPNPSFGSLSLLLLSHASRAPRLFHPCVCWGNAHTPARDGRGGMEEKGGIQSPFSTDERGNRRPTPFFLSVFLFFLLPFLLFLFPASFVFPPPSLRPFLLPRVFLVKRRGAGKGESSSSKDEKVYSYRVHLMQFLFALCRGFQGFFFFLFLVFSCLYPSNDEEYGGEGDGEG